MASKKSQMSKNATNSFGGSTSNNTSMSPMSQNKAKAMGFFTTKEVIRKAPMTKLTNVPSQPKTVIFLSTLGARKHTFIEARDSTFILKNSMLGGQISLLYIKHWVKHYFMAGFFPRNPYEQAWCSSLLYQSNNCKTW